jgi:hypothetical protein
MAHRLRLLAFLAIVGAIALQLPANCARSAEREVPSTLDPVVIQARRDREIKRQITKFVSGVVVTYFDESLRRWNQPICPLVVGLPSKPAEFVRARVLQVARDSNAPAGSENCNPNLVVVMTNDPELLLPKAVGGQPIASAFFLESGERPVASYDLPWLNARTPRHEAAPSLSSHAASRDW